MVAFECFVDTAALFAIWAFGDEGHEKFGARMLVEDELLVVRTSSRGIAAGRGMVFDCSRVITA